MFAILTRLFWLFFIILAFLIIGSLSLIFHYEKEIDGVIANQFNILEKNSKKEKEIYSQDGYLIDSNKNYVKNIFDFKKINPIILKIFAQDYPEYKAGNIYIDILKPYLFIEEFNNKLINKLTRNIYINGSLSDKVKKTLLQDRLQRKYSKDSLIKAYLSKLKFSDSSTGINRAAFEFFNKDISKLENNEIISLYSIAKAYENDNNNVQEYHNKMVKYLYSSGIISDEQYQDYYASGAYVKKWQKNVNNDYLGFIDKQLGTIANNSKFLSIYSALNIKLQKIALSQVIKKNKAFIAVIDNESGSLISYLNTLSEDKTAYDYDMESLFTVLYAIEAGMHPASEVKGSNLRQDFKVSYKKLISLLQQKYGINTINSFKNDIVKDKELLQLLKAYSGLVSGNKSLQYIDNIFDKKGNILYSSPIKKFIYQLYSKESAYQTLSLLSKYEGMLYIEDHKKKWIISLNPAISFLIYFEEPNNDIFNIYAQYLERASKYFKYIEFSKPEKLKIVMVDNQTNKRPTEDSKSVRKEFLKDWQNIPSADDKADIVEITIDSYEEPKATAPQQINRQQINTPPTEPTQPATQASININADKPIKEAQTNQITNKPAPDILSAKEQGAENKPIEAIDATATPPADNNNSQGNGQTQPHMAPKSQPKAIAGNSSENTRETGAENIDSDNLPPVTENILPKTEEKIIVPVLNRKYNIATGTGGLY